MLKENAGIMITNTAVDQYNIALANGINNVATGGPVAINGIPQGYYTDLGDENAMVLPFEQLTYIDSGIYSPDNKVVYSPIERARRAINQLTLIEDAILIYRLVRAPEKYVFNVDIGRMGHAKGKQMVAELQKQYNTKKTYDPATGTVGKMYNPQQMLESYWIVKSADSNGIQINPMTSPHNFGNLDDLEYFLKKVCRAMCIPIARYFEANTEIRTGSADGGISAEELNFAKFIMSLQKRFGLGLLNGLITHLKFKGIWDQYKLTRNKLKVVLTPPIEYQQYRRAKLLESKLNMLKAAIGDDAAGLVFSEEFALQTFMGWDKNKIETNKKQRYEEQIRRAKEKYILAQIEKDGNIEAGNQALANTLKDALAETLPSTKEIENPKSDKEEGEESLEGHDGDMEF